MSSDPAPALSDWRARLAATLEAPRVQGALTALILVNAIALGFGSLGESAFTLFQIMTLESWSMGIVRPVMEAFPYAWIFFVSYILISTFTMLNLFIAVVVNAVQAEHARELEQARGAQGKVAAEHALRAELQGLREELGAVRAALLANGSEPASSLAGPWR